MIKKHLLGLIDIRLIVFLVVAIVLCGILTLLISDKAKDFASYKKKFYGYILSFILIYALIAFLGYNKLFTELRNEFLFYQAASLLLGSLHVWLYRKIFQEFNVKTVGAELLFASLVPLYSSILFVIIYTILNGIYFAFLMSAHFIMFIVPTAIYMVFCFMMLIPPRKFITWTPSQSYEAIKADELKDILLITLMIKKHPDDEDFTSIRAQTPVRVDFGRLFLLAILGYNKQNSDDQIELSTPDGNNYNWVFYFQPKWYEKTKYLDADYDASLNRITENSVIVCHRETEKNEAPVKKEKKQDHNIYGIESHNDGADQKKINELKEPELEGPIK